MGTVKRVVRPVPIAIIEAPRVFISAPAAARDALSSVESPRICTIIGATGIVYRLPDPVVFILILLVYCARPERIIQR